MKARQGILGWDIYELVIHHRFKMGHRDINTLVTECDFIENSPLPPDVWSTEKEEGSGLRNRTPLFIHHICSSLGCRLPSAPWIISLGFAA